MLDVDILWWSVGNMNATSVNNFHTLAYDLEGTEAEETSINGISTGELQNALGNNPNVRLAKKIHDDKEKGQTNYRSSSTEASKQNVTTELVNKSSDGQWNLIKVRVGFDVTRKGERSLVINGYKFTKSRDGMGDRVFWRCSRRECKATAVTVSNKVEHIRSIHSHLPPVAAEFFSDDSSRCEQEVRFNNLVYTQRSRIRRRSQPNPSMKLSKQSVTKPCFLEQIKELACSTSYSEASNAVSHKKYSSNIGSMDCSHDSCIDSSEYASSIKKRHCSDRVLSDYPTLQTMSALLTKWVDSKQMNIENDEAKEHLSNISKCILPPKKLSNNLLNSEEYQLFNNNSILDVNNSSNPTHGDVYEDSLSKVTKSESLKKLTTLVTSSNNIYDHSSEIDLISMNKISQFITRNGTTDEDDSNRDFINDNSLKNSIINLSKAQQSDISLPSIDVNSLEHNSQRQIILLNNEQLNELLKIINCSRINNIPIQNESMASPLQTSSLVNDNLLNPIGLFTTSNPNLTGGLAQCTTTYCCSHYPRLNSKVVNRNNDCLPSFHHISCSTNLNSNPIVYSSNNCPNNLFSTMSKSLSVNESNTDGSDTHLNGHKSSSPNFPIHWKKEKIRESVEEDGVNSLNGFYDNNDTFSHQLYQDKDHGNTLEMVDNHQISVNNTPLINCSSQLLYGTNDKLSSYNTFSSTSRTTNTTNSYDSSSNSEARELIQSQSEITIQSSDNDQFLYNQIQGGILMKILNTVQHLTAKLDADADPPEVIQNCRAIQACLDTITAIKRAKSNQIFIDKLDETRSTITLEDSNDNLQHREFTSKNQENFQLFSHNFIQS